MMAFVRPALLSNLIVLLNIHYHCTSEFYVLKIFEKNKQFLTV